MELNKISGILSIILGLIFIIFPFFTTVAFSLVIGISLIFFGVMLIVSGFTAFNIIVGILSIVIGLIFLSNIAAFSFLLGFEFYIIGIIMVLAGIAGLISDSHMSKIASALLVILGIVSFALGGLSFDQPMFAAILMGLALIIEGIILYLV